MEQAERTRIDTAAGRTTAAAWGGPFFLGLCLVALGVFAIIAAGIASIASILVFGVLLAAGGAVEIVQAFRVRRTGNFFLFFLGGLLSLVVGVLMLMRPMAGLAAVTLLLAGYFFASGLFRGFTSIIDRYANWGWDFVYGIVAVILGVMLFSQWPNSSLWLVGTLVGVELLIRGSAVMGAALAMRKGIRTLRAQ
ncbi:DUF308 domain-containing protein [Myxococcaceae bacterium GXIMD 01537]